MKIIFSDQVLKKLEYFSGESIPVSGFLRTGRFGKFMVIRDMIHSPFSGSPSIDAVDRIHQMWGTEWGGVLLNEIPVDIPECLLDKIILNLNRNGYSVSYIDPETREAVYLTEGKFEKGESA